MGIADAVNEGVRQGYRDGYLRKSVVGGRHIKVSCQGFFGEQRTFLKIAANPDTDHHRRAGIWTGKQGMKFMLADYSSWKTTDLIRIVQREGF